MCDAQPAAADRPRGRARRFSKSALHLVPERGACRTGGAPDAARRGRPSSRGCQGSNAHVCPYRSNWGKGPVARTRSRCAGEPRSGRSSEPYKCSIPWYMNLAARRWRWTRGCSSGRGSAGTETDLPHPEGPISAVIAFSRHPPGNRRWSTAGASSRSVTLRVVELEDAPCCTSGSRGRCLDSRSARHGSNPAAASSNLTPSGSSFGQRPASGGRHSMRERRVSRVVTLVFPAGRAALVTSMRVEVLHRSPGWTKAIP